MEIAIIGILLNLLARQRVQIANLQGLVAMIPQVSTEDFNKLMGKDEAFNEHTNENEYIILKGLFLEFAEALRTSSPHDGRATLLAEDLEARANTLGLFDQEGGVEPLDLRWHEEEPDNPPPESP